MTPMRIISPFTRVRQSFRIRVFSLLTLLILITTVALTSFYILHESKTATERLVTEGTFLAGLLAHSSRLAAFAENREMLKESTDWALAHENVISAGIFSSEGKPLIDQNLQSTGGAAPEHERFSETLRPVLLRVRTENGPVFYEKADRIEFFAPIIISQNSASPESLYFTDSTQKGGQFIGMARVVLDKSMLAATLRRLLLTGISLGSVFLVIGACLMYLVAQGLTRPLSNLMTGVTALDRGNLSARIPVESYDELGEVSHAFNTMAESLEKREAENRHLEELLRNAEKREAKEEWEFTFDTVPDLVAVLDHDHRIVRINKAMADRLGVAKEEAIGTKAYAHLHGTGTTLDYAGISALLADGATYFEEIHQRQMGYFMVTISPLVRAGGIRGSVYVARDITERKLAEEEKRSIQAKLIQTNKMTSLGLMVSGLAHEVNNPNNSIKLTAHLLARSWQDILPVLEKHSREEGDFRIGGQFFSQAKDILPQHINGIRANSRRIEGIIKNLRDFVRKGAADVNFQAGINAIVSAAASIINVQIKQYTRHFTLKLDERVPVVKGNPQQLEQVVINLVLNALQALPDRERSVRVSTSFDPAEGFVIITVADEGEGMSADVRERIGEPFFSTKLDYGGTGLGLAISNFIVKEHKGFLEFESEPGKGTTARVKLPV